MVEFIKCGGKARDAEDKDAKNRRRPEEATKNCDKPVHVTQFIACWERI